MSPHTPLDDLDELARRAGAGDEAALEQFVRRTQPDVWRLCRYLVDAQSADDLTAEVYEHALRALPSYRGRPNGAARGPRVGARRRGRFLARPGMQDEDAGGAPGTDGPGAGTGTDEASTGPADGESRSTARAWLLTIARRRCADEIRRRVRDRRAHERLGAGPTEMPAGDGEVALQDALARLDEDRRSAFVLTQVLGLAYQEAADVVGCPVGTIRSRVARARDDLIVALGATPAGEAAGSDVTIGRGPR